MTRTLRQFMMSSALAGTLMLSGSSLAFQTPAAPSAAKDAKAPKAAAATPAPSAQDITDAKAKGLVWANTNTKVYHKDGAFYGKTKHGKFMTEADAQKAGFKAAQQPAAKKATADTKK